MAINFLKPGTVIPNPTGQKFQLPGTTSGTPFPQAAPQVAANPVVNRTNTSPGNVSIQGYTRKGNDVYDPQGNYVSFDQAQKLGIVPQLQNIPQAPGQDVNAMVNQELTSQGQDAFNLQNQSPDALQQISDMLDAKLAQQAQGQNQYLEAFNQARQQSNIPSLEQQVQDIGNQIAQRNLAYNTASNTIEDQAIPMGNITGQQAALQRQQQAEIANLTAQQQNALQRFGLAQGQQNAQMAAATQGLNLQTPQALTQLAQSYFGAPQAAAQVGLTQAQAQQAQAQAGFYQSIYGGITGQGTQAGGIPQFLQGASTTDMNGQQYVVESRVPSLGGMGLDAAKSYAGKLGIPILSDTQAQSIAGLDTTQANLADLQGKIGGLLGSGLGGTIQGKTLNQVQQLLGVGKGPALTQINSFREAAIKQIQGLASGATGLRINQAEINSAIQNLPTTSDNIETATAKLQQLAVFFANQRAAIYALGGLKASAAAMNSNSVGWF